MTRDPTYLALIQDLDQVRSIADRQRLLAHVASVYGLEHTVYFAARVPKLTAREPYIAVTYPDAWIERYKARDYVRIDPVVKHGTRTMMPLDWASFDRSDPALREFFGEAEDFGIGRHGMTFPIRGPHGELAMFSITSAAPLPEWREAQPFYLRDFQVIAHFVHELVLRLEGVIVERPRLSNRQRECLQWAAEGKTFCDIGEILGITEDTVKVYLDTCRHKLNATNITHAVARAISYNLIDLPE